MKIIETNIIGIGNFVDDATKITDHQSRVVEADSWEQYVLHYYSINNSFFRNKFPRTLPKECTISRLNWDEYHLSCIIDNGDFLTYRLAYKEGECI